MRFQNGSNKVAILNFGSCNFGLKSYFWFQIELALSARSILKSLVWFQTKLHSTQFNYHYITHPRLPNSIAAKLVSVSFLLWKFNGANFFSNFWALVCRHNVSQQEKTITIVDVVLKIVCLVTVQRNDKRATIRLSDVIQNYWNWEAVHYCWKVVYERNGLWTINMFCASHGLSTK